MAGTQGPAPDWGDATDWQKQQTGYGAPHYGAAGQQPPPGYPPPYAPQPPYAQQPPWPGGAVPAIQTYLVPAILVTLFCFLPTGIAAIVFASQVNSKRNVGDYNGAMHASKQARLWTIISLVVGIVFIGIVIIAAAASNSSQQ